MTAVDKKIATHNQRINSTTPEADVEAILHAHQEWWIANQGGDIPRMVPNFPVGDDNYIMFNLQGHPYYGIDEKVKLWEHYKQQVFSAQVPTTRIVQFVLEGDVAWIAADVLFSLEQIGEDGLAAPSSSFKYAKGTRVRSTECYLRDGGDGSPKWTMWHFHCSPAPDADEPRPAFGDTARERGELI
ncbi:YybH family protein [Mycobacterium sp. NPDC051198]